MVNSEFSDIDIVAEFDEGLGLRFMEFNDYLTIILGDLTRFGKGNNDACRQCFHRNDEPPTRKPK